MKFFVAFAALVAVSIASPILKHTINDAQELEAIIAAIQSPSTDPATAALLEEMLADILGISAGPAIIDTVVPETPVVGPAIVESPINEQSETRKPLVQIIINVRNPVDGAGIEAAAISSPVAADSVQVAESSPVVADGILVADNIQADDVIVADDVLVADGPVGVAVADLVAPQTPVIVATPDLAIPANLPEDLN